MLLGHIQYISKKSVNKCHPTLPCHPTLLPYYPAVYLSLLAFPTIYMNPTTLPCYPKVLTYFCTCTFFARQVACMYAYSLLMRANELKTAAVQGLLVYLVAFLTYTYTNVNTVHVHGCFSFSSFCCFLASMLSTCISMYIHVYTIHVHARAMCNIHVHVQMANMLLVYTLYMQCTTVYRLILIMYSTCRDHWLVWPLASYPSSPFMHDA